MSFAMPLGLISPEALDFERAHGLASNPIGRLVLAALILSQVTGAQSLTLTYTVDAVRYEGGYSVALPVPPRDQLLHGIGSPLNAARELPVAPDDDGCERGAHAGANRS